MQQAKKSSTWRESVLEQFRVTARINRQPETVNAYCYDIEKFLDWTLQEGVKRLSYLRADHVIRYMAHCRRDKSDATICRYYMAIRAFCKFLRKAGLMQEDITEDIPSPSVRATAPHIPTKAEIERLMQAPDTSTEVGTRDRAILELLYSSGLRATELCDLELYDVTQDFVRVRCGKRGKTRTVPITHSAWHWTRLYIEGYRGTDPGPLFATTFFKSLRRQLLSRIVVKYAEKAGLKHMTTHTLRHACATHLLDHGADIRMIQAVLGHASIASTQRYTHLSTGSLQSMFTQFHPRSHVII